MHNSHRLIELKEIKKYYSLRDGIYKRKNEYLKSVDGVSLSINQGEILGVIGESGCGKSTLGKTILKLHEPTGGAVVYKNKVIFDVENNAGMNKKELAKLRKHIQIVFQDPYSALDPKQTVGHALAEGVLKHHVVEKHDVNQYCEEILQLCGISSSLIDYFPHEFSGGQRQRIGIARALAVQPEFLVCDEVTAALDVSVQSQILNLLLDLRDRYDMTYLFISHNISVVKNMCDKVAVMYLGKIMEIAESTEICIRPLHPYSQFLIASLPKEVPWDIKPEVDLLSMMPMSKNVPDGCRFHPRCKYARKCCIENEPDMIQVDEGHYVRCHIYDNH